MVVIAAVAFDSLGAAPVGSAANQSVSQSVGRSVSQSINIWFLRPIGGSVVM